MVERRLAGDGLGLEHATVRLDDAEAQDEALRRLLLGLLVDGLLRLHPEDLVLEHLAEPSECTHSAE